MTRKKRKRPFKERPIYKELEPKIIDEFWEYNEEGEKVEYVVIVGNGRSIFYLRAPDKAEAKEKGRQKMRYLYHNPHVRLAYLERMTDIEVKKFKKNMLEGDNKPKNKWEKRKQEYEQERLRRNLRRK